MVVGKISTKLRCLFWAVDPERYRRKTTQGRGASKSNSSTRDWAAPSEPCPGTHHAHKFSQPGPLLYWIPQPTCPPQALGSRNPLYAKPILALVLPNTSSGSPPSMAHSWMLHDLYKPFPETLAFSKVQLLPRSTQSLGALMARQYREVVHLKCMRVATSQGDSPAKQRDATGHGPDRVGRRWRRRHGVVQLLQVLVVELIRLLRDAVNASSVD